MHLPAFAIKTVQNWTGQYDILLFTNKVNQLDFWGRPLRENVDLGS